MSDNTRQQMIKSAKEFSKKHFIDERSLDSAGNIVDIIPASTLENNALHKLLEKNPDYDVQEFKKMVNKFRQQNKKLEESFLF